MKNITLFFMMLVGFSTFANTNLYNGKFLQESKTPANISETALPIDFLSPKPTESKSNAFFEFNTRADEVNYYLSGSFNDAVLGDENYKFSPMDDGTGNYLLEFNGTLTNTFLINTGSWDLFYATDGYDPIELGVPFQTDINGGYYITTENKNNIINAVLVFNPQSGLLTVTGEYQQPEYAYQIYSNFLPGIADFIEQENGTWTYATEGEVGMGQFYIFKVNKLDKALISYVYASGYQYIEPGQPIECSETSGYTFNILPGKYTFTFDPQAMTLNTTGEISPETFYLESPVIHTNYPLSETEEGSGIYTWPGGVPVLYTGYYIRSSYGNYYGSNGSVLTPGEAYQTNSTYEYINTVNKQSIVNADLKFIPQTGELTIDGTLRNPDIAIIGNMFTEPSQEESWGMYPIQLRNGMYKSEVPIPVYDGDFAIMMYDASVGLEGGSFCYWGPEEDFTPIYVNQITQCYNNVNTFKIEAGSYYFAFDLETQSLLIYEEESILPEAYIIENGKNLYADGAELSFNIFPVSIPSDISDFTVFYKQQNETEYKSLEITGNSFTLNLEGLTPQSDYIYEIYAIATDGVSEYKSEVLEYEFQTSEIEVGFSRSQVDVTDKSISFNYYIQSNLLGDYTYELYYALIPDYDEISIEAANNAVYDVSFILGKEGIFEVENLSPTTDYVMYYYLQVKAGETEGKTAIYYLIFTTGESSFVNEISTSNDSEAIYYDLQGRRVANPSKGIFIEVKGSETRKIAIP